MHRTIAHRLVRTLEAHRRDNARRIALGAGPVLLADPVEQDLRMVARPVMEELAERTRATAHLVLRENQAEVRALLVVEPRNAQVHVAFRPGQIHPIDRGSAGLAMPAALPAVPGERPSVETPRGPGTAPPRRAAGPSVARARDELAGR